MISKKLCEQILLTAMSSGADFAELYAQNTQSNYINFIDGRVDSINDVILSGVGIRIFNGTKTVYASTTDLTEVGLINCAKTVASAFVDIKHTEIQNINLYERVVRNSHFIERNPANAPAKIKTDILKTACFAAKNFNSKISQVNGAFMDSDHKFLVANSDGIYVKDRRILTRISVSAIASNNGENQSGFHAPGKQAGLEMFDIIKPQDVGTHAAAQAITNLNADYCKAGQMPVAIENSFGGVIFHEACGHSLEATSVGIGTSQMAGKLGQKIANEKVTAIDDGTMPGEWGSINIDDEGNAPQKNILIENGVLKSYMVDRLGSRRMSTPMTGNSRRQGYEYEPTSRMTNTYIANGKDKNEDIIASIEYGLYAKELGGGSVNPLTGAFNFSVCEGYMIRNGKICEAVRGASLIGKGSQILQDIDMVGQNLEMGQGMCGSSSGSVPVNVGQPLIRVSKITVGGR